jgi:uncharacterized protein (DUF1697 family)
MGNPHRQLRQATDASIGSCMSKYVALFRGINVGKAKRIAMADLRALLTSMGYGDVSTLLNSGNAVFSSSKGTAATHAKQIRAAVLAELGVDALVIVKSAKQIAAVIAGNALTAVATDPSRLLVALVDGAAALASVGALSRKDWGDERMHVGDEAAYLWCANGILESKAAVALLKGLELAGTTRNWGTMEKLHALLQA